MQTLEYFKKRLNDIGITINCSTSRYGNYVGNILFRHNGVSYDITEISNGFLLITDLLEIPFTNFDIEKDAI